MRIGVDIGEQVGGLGVGQGQTSLAQRGSRLVRAGLDVCSSNASSTRPSACSSADRRASGSLTRHSSSSARER